MKSLAEPSESELSSVPSKLFITLSGQHLHKSKIAFGSKILKISVIPSFLDKILQGTYILRIEIKEEI